MFMQFLIVVLAANLQLLQRPQDFLMAHHFQLFTMQLVQNLLVQFQHWKQPA
jgi:hypothetical protein